MPFLSELDTRTVSGGMFRLLEPLIYLAKSERVYTVPIGFETNFASFPGIVRLFLPVNGRHRKAATLHDYLYNTGITGRKKADTLFHEAMENTGVRRPVGWLMFSGVRAFGWIIYRKYHPE